MRRTSTLLLALVACTAWTGVAQAAAPAEPAVAPPATPQVAAACEQRSEAAKATQDDTTHVPHGVLGLNGCVSDTSGIEHVVVRWNRGDEHGRICTDPDVVLGEWICPWDTTNLPEGKYELELIAVDAAGNKGSSTRKYEIDDRTLAPPVAKEPAPAPAPAPSTPEPAPQQPAPDTAPPAPSPAPTPTQPATPGVAPPAAEATTPTEPVEPVEPQAEFSAIQQLVADRVTACEQGGVEGQRTDDPDVTDQRDQVQLVLDCLSPALALAGADTSSVRESAPLPIAVVVEVADAAARADLDDALPDTIAGVPVLVTAPELPASAPGALTPTPPSQ